MAMNAFRAGRIAKWNRDETGHWSWAAAVVTLGLLATVGCDLQMDKSANRFEQMGEETKKLNKLLQQVTDEASAKAHIEEIKQLGDNLRKIQGDFLEDASNNKTNYSVITNHRQAGLFRQVALGVERNQERIREADEKAGEMIDEALKDIHWQ
jgi:hypothetical protein